MVVVLSRLDEAMRLDVPLHLLPRRHKVVVAAVHLVVPSGTSGVCGEGEKGDGGHRSQVSLPVRKEWRKDGAALTRDARAELVGKLGQ